MAQRPIWRGHLRLALVSCPVALYTATNSGGDVHFNLINPKTNNRIKMITTDPDTGPIERSSLVKGYEVSKGEYALFTKEELAKLEGEDEGGTIEIVEFVDPLEVDLAYVEKSYWVAPGSKNVRGFDLLRSVLAETKKVG